MRTEELVTEIAMAMLDVDELKSNIPCPNSRAMKILNNVPDFRIAEHWVVRREFKLSIENGMVVKNLRFGFVVVIGAAVTAGMGQLQADDQVAIRACCRAMFLNQTCA